MEIKFLADVPYYIPLLSDKITQQWTHYKNITEIERISCYKKRLNKKKLPLSLIAFENESIAGTVSLVSSSKSSNLNPWLVSLFVLEEYRNNGFGRSLVKKLLDHARTLGFNSVFLHTSKCSSYYQHQGWEIIKIIADNDQKVSLMKIDLN